MPLVSVIMPSYNSENSIEYSVNSVLDQTFTDFELIIVDGSTDTTESIIKKINDERIKFIKVENKGVVNSYKIGIENASGEYITFCDSDDLYNADFLEKAVKDIQINNCDFVSYGYDLIDEKFNYIESIYNTIPTGFYNKNQIENNIMPKLVFNSFNRKEMFILLVLRWNKIYTKELLNKILPDLDNNCYQIEDNVFTTLVLLNCNSFYISNDYKCYKYVAKANSISNGYKDANTLEKYLYSVDRIHQILNKYNYKGNYNQLDFLAYDSARIVYRRAAKSVSYEETKKLISIINNNSYIKRVKKSDLCMLKNYIFYYLNKLKLYRILYLIFRIM